MKSLTLLRPLVTLVLIWPLMQLNVGISEAQAEPKLDTVPPALSPWLKWVEDPKHLCATRGARSDCAWPTQLSVELQPYGASFQMSGSLDHDGALPLPYAEGSWPLQVALQDPHSGDWSPVAVSQVKGQPQLRLSSGAHRVRGQLLWLSPPDWIQTPQSVGMTQLTGRGVRAGEWVERDGQGRLWLRTQTQSSQGEGRQDSLRLQVFRVIYDGVPLRVETYLQLNTTGQAREVNLRGLEIEGSLPVKLQSELTAEWRGEELRVYLKPGRTTLQLTSLIRAPLSALKVPALSGGESPTQEVWVWHHNEQLRSVSLSGLDMVDPDQTPLPQQLKGGAYTFIASPGERLKIKELSRGVSRPPANQLSLSRKIWLDLDGEGFVSRDQLSGQLNQGGRLNYRQEGLLGRADAGEPLLITQDPDSGLEGLELRTRQVEVSADIRAAKGGVKFDAVGWDFPVNHLDIQLELPPGYRLLYALGASSASGAWLESWHMIDFFVILLTVVVFRKLFGWTAAGLTLLMMTLYHGVYSAPEWSWLYLCAAGVLIKVIKGRFLRFALYAYGAVTFASLFVMVLSVVHSDLRLAIHPQLDAGLDAFTEIHEDNFQKSAPSRRSDMTLNRKRAKRSPAQSKSKGFYEEKRALQQLDPNAIVQTGPGLPNWHRRSYQLNFSGPVHQDHVVQLGVLTPGWERALLTLRALFILGVFTLLARWLWRLRDEDQTGGDSGAGPTPTGAGEALKVTALILSCSAALLSPSLTALSAQPTEDITPTQNQQLQQQVQAPPAALSAPPQASSAPPAAQDAEPRLLSFPPPQLLDQLSARLAHERECLGDCLYLPLFSLEVSGDQLTLKAEVHAERPTSFTLPGSLQTVKWHSVHIKGVPLPTRGESRGDALTLVARVPQGQHQVTAHATLPPLETLKLAIYDRPHQLSLKLKGWRQDSSQEKVEGLIELTRLRSGPSKPSPSARVEPPITTQDLTWYLVRRSLIIGLPWQVETTVSRPYAVTLGAQAFTLPLLEGERLLSPDVSLTEDGARVQLSEGTRSLSFMSELNPRAELKLVAPQARRWSEEWHLNCGLIWQCAWEGLNPNNVQTGLNGAQWSPWPGEEVNLRFTRPKGVQGAASTIKTATLIVKPGEQLLNGEVKLYLTASQGGARALTLPEEARQVRLFINGRERNDPLKGRVVRLPFQPGENSFSVTWTQPWAAQNKLTSPAVRLDGELVNVSLELHKPSDRWLLWASGPMWGPAVLFYGFLFVCVLLAFILSKSGLTPLSFGSWATLLLGFTQEPTLIIGVIIWFTAFELRGRYSNYVHPHVVNICQIWLAIGTYLFVTVLFQAVQSNLLGEVEMQVSGGGSTERLLKWYIDRSSGAFPVAELYTVPRWCWQLLMLIWALWLANRLIQWFQWAWAQFQEGGAWRSAPAPQERAEVSHNQEQTRGPHEQ